MALGIPLLLGGVALVVAFSSKTAKAKTTTPSTTSTEGVPLPADLQLAMSSMIYKIVDPATQQVRPGLSAEVLQQATAFAAELEARGYPDAARYIRELAKKAGTSIPTTTTVSSAPLSAEILALVNRTLQVERDPKRIREMIAILGGLPNAKDPQIVNLILMLEALAVQQEAQQSQNQTLSKVQTILTSDTPSVKTPSVVQLPQPKSSIEMAAEAMCANLRAVQGNASSVKASKGKEDQGLVKRFQSLAMLSSDGKTGPGTLIAAAKNGVSALPYVMYWPKSATSKTVLSYRSSIYELADQAQASGDVTRASQLRESAAKERGQAGIVGTMPA